MIAIGKQHAQIKGAELIAHDTHSNGQPVYWVPDNEYPMQDPIGNPLDLIDPEWLLKNIFRKYSLGKKEISKLVNFYKNDNESMDLGDSWKLQQGFKALEKKLLDVLKTHYEDKSAFFEPYHDPDWLGSIGFVAASKSGKTWRMADILLRPEFSKKKVYILSANARSDKSIQRLKARGRKSVFVDIDGIESQRQLSLAAVTPGSIIVYDDIRESIPDDDPRKKWLYNFQNVLLTKGRHHKRSVNSPGTGFMYAQHVLKSGHHGRVQHTETQYLYVFPSSSPHQITDYLVSKIGWSRHDVKIVMAKAKGSRWLLLHLSQPLFAMWKTGIMLL